MRKDFHWILAIVFLGLLSFADALLTWEAVTSGAAKELYVMRRHVWAQFSIVFCLLVYLVITGIHLQFAWQNP